MRILVAADQWFPDVRGGSARVAAETAQRLARLGHEVVVLAPHSAAQPSLVQDGNLTVFRTVPRTKAPQSLTDIVAVGRQARQRQRGRFDILVAHQTTNAVGLLLAHLGAPLVLVYHASAVREARLRGQGGRSGRRSARGWLLGHFLAALERIAVSRAARILVLSEYSRTLVVEDHPERSGVVCEVSGGVDTSAFTPDGGQSEARRRLGIDVSAPLAVVVRRLEPALRVDIVLEAFQILDSAAPTLVIVGSGTHAHALEHDAYELGIADRVRFVGLPDEDELRDWYRAADIFVLPPAPHEGFGLATLEALASGTPVVACPVGSTPDLLRPLEPSLLAAKAEAAALAAAIRDILPSLSSSFRERCREYAHAHYSWDNVILHWEQALQDAARSGRATDHELRRP